MISLRYQYASIGQEVPAGGYRKRASYADLRDLTDEDLQSIYAYLKTVPPVRNRVPEPLLPPARAAWK